jgi:hypothetical protein
MKPVLMLIGLGDLGGVILEFLAREEGLGRIVVASRDEVGGRARCNLVALGAASQGFEPVIDFVPLDLNQRDEVAETVLREAPDIILTAATMQTWWLPDRLPEPQAGRIKQAGFGIWLPVHLTLTRKLMEALRDASYQGVVLTAPYPDVVNCVLGRLGLAPSCGIGNIDEIVPKVRMLAARELKQPLNSVKVTMVYHHALHKFVLSHTTLDQPSSEQSPPFYLRVEHLGRDVTESVRAKELLFSAFAIPPGPVSHFLTAASTMELINSLRSEDEKFLHAPGPEGLPGGYPIYACQEGVRLAPIEGLSREEAVRINRAAHRFDGIDRIEEDGTVVFREDPIRLMSETIGYECHRLHPDEAEDRADELIQRFEEYASLWGVSL